MYARKAMYGRLYMSMTAVGGLRQDGVRSMIDGIKRQDGYCMKVSE